MKQRLPANYTKVSLSKLTVPSFNGTFAFPAQAFVDPPWMVNEYEGSHRVKQFKGLSNSSFQIVDVPRDLYDCPAQFDETFNLIVRYAKNDVTYRLLLNEHFEESQEDIYGRFGWWTDKLYFDRYVNQVIEPTFYFEVWPKPWAAFTEAVYVCNGLEYKISLLKGNDITLTEEPLQLITFPITL